MSAIPIFAIALKIARGHHEVSRGFYSKSPGTYQILYRYRYRIRYGISYIDLDIR